MRRADRNILGLIPQASEHRIKTDACRNRYKDCGRKLDFGSIGNRIFHRSEDTGGSYPLWYEVSKAHYKTSNAAKQE